MALPLALQSCANYTQESLSEAIIQNPVSDKLLAEIYKERIQLMETLTKEKIEKGNFFDNTGTCISLLNLVVQLLNFLVKYKINFLSSQRNMSANSSN